MANREELQLVIKVDPETGKLQAFNAEMGNTKRIADSAGKGISGMSMEVFKGVAAWDLLKSAVRFVADSLREGIQEMQEGEAALNRMGAMAARAGLSLDELSSIAEDISADGLMQLDEAMQGIADLTQRGFGTEQIRDLSVALKDIAAAAGGDVSDNFKTMSDAILTGKVRSAELQRLLPGLSQALANVDKNAGEAGRNQAILNAVMEQGERVMGAAAEKAKTYEGQMQIVDNRIADVKEALAQALIPAMTQGIDTLLGLTKGTMTWKEALDILTQTLGGTLLDGINIVKLALISMQILFEAALPLAIMKAETAFTGWITRVAGKVAGFLQGLQSLPGAPDSLSGAIIKLLQIQADSAIAFAQSGQAVQVLEGRLSELGDEYKTTWDAIGKGIPILDHAAKGYGDLGTSTDKLTESKKKLWKELEAEWKMWENVIEQMKKALDIEMQMSLEASQNTGLFQGTAGDFSVLTPLDPSQIEPSIIAMEQLVDMTGEWAQELQFGVYQRLLAIDPIMAAIFLKMTETKDETINWKDALDDVGGVLSGIGDIFSEIGQQFGSETFSAIGQGFTGAGNAAMGFGRIMSGDVLGGIQQVIQGVGELFNALKKLFSHDWGEDVSRTINNFLPGLQLSEQMLEQLAKSAEEFGDSMVAVFMNLGAIMDDVGVSAENVNTFIAELRNGFSLLETGAITADQLIEVLNDTFAELAEASTDSLGLISAEMREIIALAQQFGLEVEGINSFITGQLQGVAGGVNQVAQNMNVNTQGRFNALQTQVLTAFNAMIANGMSAQEAMAALGPAFDVLSAAVDEFGFSANAAIKPLLELQHLAEEFPKAFAKLEGINAQLVGLANTGNLSKEAFKTLERQSRTAFNRIMQDGKASRGELTAMAPTLNLLARLSEEFGFKLDKQTQALIDQASAFGLIEDQSPEDTFEQLNTTMTDLTAAVREFIAALKGIPSYVSTTVDTNYTTSGTPTPPPPTGNPSTDPGDPNPDPNQPGPNQNPAAGSTGGTVVVEATIPVYLDGKKISTQVAKYYTTRRTAFNTDKLRFTTLK